jgi:hypothetical protein
MGKPINQNNNGNVNLTGKAVKWDGPNIPCLDLCTGDTVTTVVYKIGQRVCELVTSYEELEDLDFQCILDYCTSCPKDYSIKAIIQLLLDNDCKIQDLITGLENQINNINNAGIVLSLNLKCIEDELLLICRDITTYTINDLLQCFINIICDHETSIQAQATRILTLEQLICSLQDIVVNGEYNEPDLTNACINGGTPTEHHIFTGLLADEVCDIRTDLGTTAEVQDAISNACITDFLTDPDIIRNPTNLAQDETNKWIVLCAALDRLKDIEENCCSPVCDDIKIGFSATYSEIDEEYSLSFNNGVGTFIPPGFTDCGTTITFTDQHSNTFTIISPITNGAVIVVPQGSLFVTDPVTVTINTCFEHTNGLQCIDCFVQTIPSQEVGCKICKLCAVGDETAHIQVTYTTLASATPVTVTLYGGACLSFDLPDEAPTITQIVVLSGTISLVADPEADCTDIVLPTPVEESCWFFEFPPDTTPLSYNIDSIIVDDVQIDIAAEECFSSITYSSLTIANGVFPLTGTVFSYALVPPDVDVMGLTVNVPASGLPPLYVVDSDACTSNYYTFTQVAGAGSALYDVPSQMCLSYALVGGKVGLLLTILGQDPSIIPEIELKHSDTSNTKVWIKGTLTTPCNCPV